MTEAIPESDQEVENSEAQQSAKLYANVNWQSVYRVYDKNAGTHLFTTNKKEVAHLVSVGWRDKRLAWFTVTNVSGTTPVYRVYNKNSGEHLYTISKAERDNVVRAGWKSEGVAFRASSRSNASLDLRSPVYRLFNPNAGPTRSSHHYTKSAAEALNLQRAG